MTVGQNIAKSVHYGFQELNTRDERRCSIMIRKHIVAYICTSLLIQVKHNRLMDTTTRCQAHWIPPTTSIAAGCLTCGARAKRANHLLLFCPTAAWTSWIATEPFTAAMRFYSAQNVVFFPNCDPQQLVDSTIYDQNAPR